MSENHSTQQVGISRRDFLSAAVSAAAIISMNTEAEAASSRETGLLAGAPYRPVGISEEAYRRARARAVELVSKMTLAEKVSQTGTSAPAIPRLGIPAYGVGNEALHGLVRGAPVTSFPLPLALAAAWNPLLIDKIYTAVSDEARGWNSHDGTGMLFFSPTMLNLFRDPRWGRCEEGLGEDPCLASTIAVHTVKGMQGNDPNYLKTSCCAKHFICNNTDNDRLEVSAPVDARSYWEYYTRCYQACVVEGGVFNVMGAYSAVNGIPCCANHCLLTDLLRRRWGFRGYVVSDCGAIECIAENHHYVPTLEQAAALGIQAGCDINCGDAMPAHLARAVALELVSEEEIGHAVARWYTGRFLLGEFDPKEKVPYSHITFDVCNSKAHQELAVAAARETIVLLKNQNNFLPLNPQELKSIAVIGPTMGFHLGGYSGGPSVNISPLDGIADALGISVPRKQVWGNEMVNSHNVQTQGSSEGGTNIDYIYNDSWVEFGPQDFTGRTSLAIRASSAGGGATVFAHADSLKSAPFAEFKVPDTGDWQKWETYTADISGLTGEHAVFFTFSGGQGPIVNLEWFQLRPYIKPVPTPGKPILRFEAGCTVTGERDDAMFTAAVDAAAKSDVVILVCGVNQEVDGEGHDRPDIKLTGVQHELIQAVYKANPKTVLVLSTNNTVAINWEQDNLPAIVLAVFAGQAQGTAIADVLFGKYNPGGKLPCTWYRSIDQLPDFHDYDLRKGRTYMYTTADVLYPFGYGLSYTQFKVDNWAIKHTDISARQPLQATFTVTNTGNMAGSEVVQLYIHAPETPGVKRPIKQLAAFARVELKPGETRKVTLTVPYTHYSFWYWHEDDRKFALQPGTATVHLGDSSTNVLIRDTVNVQPQPADMGEARWITSTAAPAAIS